MYRAQVIIVDPCSESKTRDKHILKIFDSAFQKRIVNYCLFMMLNTLKKYGTSYKFDNLPGADKLNTCWRLLDDDLLSKDRSKNARY